MGLIKFLPWLIIIGAVAFFLYRQKEAREREQMERELREMRRRLSENAVSSGSPEEMVACAHCGTFFPRKEGVTKNGKFYCSRDCARRDS